MNLPRYGGLVEQQPPRRYPVLGFSILGGFLLSTVVLAVVRNASLIAALAAAFSLTGDESSGPDEEVLALLSPADQHALVRLGHAMRSVSCLANAADDAPGELCRHEALAGIAQLSQSLLHPFPELDELPDIARAVENARAVEPVAREVAEALRSGDPGDIDDEMRSLMLDVGSEGMRAAWVLDGALALDDERWSEAVEEPMDDTPPAATEPQKPRPAPEPSAAEPRPTPAPIEAGATTHLAQQITDTLVETARLLAEAGHDSGRLMDATWRARTRLESLGPRLAAYRNTPREPATQDRALTFARAADQANSKLLRATQALHEAARKAVNVTGMDGFSDPYVSAGELLEAATVEASAAALLAADAP